MYQGCIWARTRAHAVCCLLRAHMLACGCRPPRLYSPSPLLRITPCSASETEVAKTPAPAASSGAVEYVEDTDFSISKVSFGSILTPAGSFLLLYGFGAYFTFFPGGDLSSLMLIYGFPMALLGFALSYAQVRHPCKWACGACMSQSLSSRVKGLNT